MKEEGSSVVSDVVSGVSSRAVAVEGSDPILIPGATPTQLPIMRENHVPLSFFAQMDQRTGLGTMQVTVNWVAERREKGFL